MNAAEIRLIREFATQFAKEHCMHILQQLHDDSEKDDSKYSGGNFVAALEFFGTVLVNKLREENSISLHPIAPSQEPKP